MKANNVCHWLLLGSTQCCEKLGVYDYCQIHRMRLRKMGPDPHSPYPCRRCGVGTQSETRLCKHCGAEKVKKQLIRIEEKVRRLYPNVMSELYLRATWIKRLLTFVGLSG